MKTVRSQKEMTELLNTILSAQAETDDCLCSSVYPDVCTGDSHIVRWMEADGNHLMQDMISYLDTELFEATGRHFNMCNNSPTDGAVLIFWEEMNDEAWSRTGHLEYFLASFDNWRANGDFTNQPSLVTQFETLDDAIGRCCIDDPDLGDWFNPNEEFWVQIMNWNRNGFPEDV